MSNIVRVVDRTWSTCMEQLQEGYVAAVASTIGATAQFVTRDYHKYDVELIRQPDAELEAASVRVQLKSTTTIAPKLGDDSFDYKFKARSDFEALAMRRTTIKHILVVMVVHPDQNLWTTATQSELSVQHCCYWLNLEGQTAPPSPDAPRVSVPTANVFDAASLSGMLDRIELGGVP